MIELIQMLTSTYRALKALPNKAHAFIRGLTELGLSSVLIIGGPNVDGVVETLT